MAAKKSSSSRRRRRSSKPTTDGPGSARRGRPLVLTYGPMRRVFSPTAVVRSAFAAASIALLLSGAAGASSRDAGPYRVLAGPYSRKDVKAGVGRPEARAALKGLIITVEFLDPEARAAFVKSVAPSMPDPFATRPGQPEIYSAFRVGFDNRSPFDVQFQAGNVVMITDRKTQSFAVDLTDLYRVAA